MTPACCLACSCLLCRLRNALQVQPQLRLYVLQTLRAEGPRAAATVIDYGLERRQSNPHKDTEALFSSDLSDYQAASEREDFDASKYKLAR